MQQLADIKNRLICYIEQADERLELTENHPSLREAPTADEDALPALLALCQLFSLSEFEKTLLVLCAGIELEGEFASLCAKAQGNQNSSYPMLGLALSVFNDGQWQALSAQSPLRYWRLINIQPGSTLHNSRLRIDERILQYLAGAWSLDEALEGIIKPLNRAEHLPPSQQDAVEEVLSHYRQVRCDRQAPIIHLSGQRLEVQQAIADLACEQLDLNLYHIDTKNLPPLW